MEESASLLFPLLALAACVLSIPGVAGFADIFAALRMGEFERLSAPRHWPATRALAGACVALPVYTLAAPLGASAIGAALCAALLAFAVAPLLLREVRQRAERALLDELALHLDLMAVVLESGAPLPNALAVCADRAPDGALRRAWARAVLHIHRGDEVLEVLRGMDQRMGIRQFGALVTALRGAERSGADVAVVVRERARQAAASRFARAERQARLAPLKLWAAMMLCLAPCTLVLLAFPVARLLAQAVDR